MMNRNKYVKRMLFPHPSLVILLCIISAALLIYSFIALPEQHPLRIVSYALSFIALTLSTLRIPALIRWIKRFRQQNPYYLRYRTDVQLRINMSLYITFCFSAAYALFQFCLGLWHHSAWFYAMSGYYLLLALMRLMLVRHTRHHAPGENTALEWRKYRLCGVCLIFMNLALAVFTLYFVFRIRTFFHHEITTIAMAAYTFTALTVAIINAIRYKKYGSPAYSAVKAIALVAATVSILTLENAMLTTFGQSSSERFRQLILGATGVLVILLVQGISLYMITNATRRLRTLHTAK